MEQYLTCEASQQSHGAPVLHIVVFYFHNESVELTEIDSEGRALEPSSIIELWDDATSHTVVVLGSGETEEQAKMEATEYLRRLAKWDGLDPTNVKLVLFGCDVSQSQFVQEIMSQY